MSKEQLHQAFGLIEQHQELASFEGAKSEALVKQAEEALGLQFPPTYREFLGRYGCGDIAGQEFFGLIDGEFLESSVPNAIWLTFDERRSGALPDAAVVVCDFGDGSYGVIDCSLKNREGESPIVVWWPGVDAELGTCERVAEDFGSFLLERIVLALERSK